MVIGLAITLRFAASFVIPMTTRSDAGAYWTMASSLAEGEIMVDAHGNYAYYCAGYPILLAGAFTVLGKSLATVLAVNLVLAAISIVLIYCIGLALDGYLVGLLAAAFWAVYIPSITMANSILKENLLIPLILSLIWITVVWPHAKHRRTFSATAGVITGLLAIVGPTGCVVSGGLIVMMFVWGCGWRQPVINCAVFIVLMLIVLAPWLYRNYVVVGSTVLNTNGGFNLYLGNNPAATGRFVSIGSTPMRVEWNRLREAEGEVAAAHEAGRQAREYIKENLGRTLALSLKKMALFWEPPFRRGNNAESGVKSAIRILWIIQYLALLALATVGVIGLERAWPLYLAVLLFVTIHMPFYIMSRYRLPVMSVMCVLAAYAMIAIGRKWRLCFSTRASRLACEM